MTGPSKIYVRKQSAIASRRNEDYPEFSLAIEDDHSNLVKFQRGSKNYERILGMIKNSNHKSAMDDDQYSELLESLRFDEIDDRHGSVRNAHTKTCKWFLSHPKYLKWLDRAKLEEHHGFFWLKGKPGAGKSTITKFALHEMKRLNKKATFVWFFFNARGAVLERDILGMYRSILYQLLRKIPELKQVLGVTGRSVSSMNPPVWTVEILQELLRHVIQSLGRQKLFIFVDALDEGEEEQIRDMVSCFEELGEYATNSGVELNIYFSSRHYPHITVTNSMQLILEDEADHARDIENYLQSEFKATKDKTIDMLRAKILERARGVFLWVVLVARVLKRENDHGQKHKLFKILEKIPDDLGKLFENILTRDSQNLEEMKYCVLWILFAKRPLKLEELYYAILAGTSPDDLAAWDPENISLDDMKRFIISSSKGLAELTRSKEPCVQLIHETVREFLLKDRLSQDGLLRTEDHESSHVFLRDCCETYLDSKQFGTIAQQDLPHAKSSEGKELRESTCKKYPLLEYSVLHIFHHADLAAERGEAQVEFFKHLHLGRWIHFSNLLEKAQIRRYTKNANLAYIFADKNYPSLIQALYEQKVRFDNPFICSERHEYPICAALANRNRAAVAAILSPPSSSRQQKRENFSIGSEMLDTLIEKYREDHSSCVPSSFHFLLAKCAPSILFNLLKSDLWEIDPRRRDESDRTLLHLVALGGNTDVVGFLLKNSEIDINARDSAGRTVLFYAANDGDEKMVKLLLDTSGVEVNFEENYSRTPLISAAANGHGAVVKLLLETGKTDINQLDDIGKTPLCWAAANGHQTVVELLLKIDIDINSRGISSKTPVLRAAENGHNVVVNLLLEAGEVDINQSDNERRTPLCWAAINGHEAVVRLLLENGKANVDSRDKNNQTPLSHATRRGHDAVVKLLLEMGNADISEIDENWEGLLSWASRNGHSAVVKLLLGAQAAVNGRNANDETALLLAAKNGHEAVVKLLLGAVAIVINARDRSGNTPVFWAAKKGHEGVVKLLLEAQAAVNGRNAYDETPLLLSVKYGHEAVVKRLLRVDKIDINSRDNRGRTPLSWAAENGHEAVVKLLLRIDKIDINSQDNRGRTPLSWAAANGHEAVVRLLLETGKVDINRMDQDCQTPLSLTRSGAVFRLLCLSESSVLPSTTLYP
jgi:ankyrin repeat protein